MSSAALVRRAVDCLFAGEVTKAIFAASVSARAIRSAHRPQGGLQQACRSVSEDLLEPALRAISLAFIRSLRSAAVLSIATLLAVAAPVPVAHAMGDSDSTPVLPEVVGGSDYLHYHRDIRYRMRGLAALEEGRFDDALAAFRKAARYADKPSQAMVAELLWKGDGVARDRAAAYAWMDLAAERGHRPWVAFREAYWAELDSSERERALKVGRGLYAEYGDAVAKPRLEHQLSKRRAKFTGSRVGMVRSMKIYMPINGMWSLVPETKVYDPRFWHADQYWEWQDQIWEDLPEGIVTVREPEAARERDIQSGVAERGDE